MARTFQITSLFPKLTVIDNVLLAIEGLRPTKFVMWRFQSSYKDVYEKPTSCSSRPASSIARTPRCATCRMASNASSKSCSASPATRKSFCSTSRPPDCHPAESTEMAQFLMKLDPKLAILLIEHDMDVVFDVAHEISVLHFGEISGNRNA